MIIHGTGKLLANELGALLTAATGNHHDNNHQYNDHQYNDHKYNDQNTITTNRKVINCITGNRWESETC